MFLLMELSQIWITHHKMRDQNAAGHMKNQFLSLLPWDNTEQSLSCTPKVWACQPVSLLPAKGQTGDLDKQPCFYFTHPPHKPIIVDPLTTTEVYVIMTGKG